MDDKHDPNGSVPTGTFRAAVDGQDGHDGRHDERARSSDEVDIPIEIVLEEEQPRPNNTLHGTGALSFARPRSDEGGLHPDGTPRRKRTSTLMGVPYPGRSNLIGPNDLPLDEISNAIDSILEDQPTHIYAQAAEGRPTSVYTREDRPTTVFTREEQKPVAPVTDERRDPALEAMLQSNSIARPDAMPPGEIIDVVAHRMDDTYQLDVVDRRNSSKVPVLAPAQFLEARERDSRAAALAFARDDAAYDALPDDGEEVPARPRERRPSPVAEAAREPARARAEEPATRAAPAPSSLAPLELSRPRAAQPAKPRRDAASPAGYAMVAAMVLIGIGGWWLTAGGFERSQPMAAANLAPPAPSAPAPVTRPFAPESSAHVPPGPAEPVAVAIAPLTAVKPNGHVARKGSTSSTSAAPEGLAETPTRSQVIAGLNGVRSSVQACADGRSGVAEVDVTIAANGVVTNALVGGDFGGTPQGSCIARAVRKARFPEFKKDRFRLLYPYAL